MPVANHTILCFASGYDAPPTSKHHVMHLLAEHNQVLWVNYHASRTPSASSSDLLYMAKKLKQVFAGLKNPRPNLYVLTPLVVPLPGSAWAKKLNRWLLVKQIRRALRKLRGLAHFAESSEQNVPVPLSAQRPLQLWSFTPDISYLLGKFGESKVVYYCVDDHSQFTGYDVQQVLAEEGDLCRRADLVITTSMVLQEAKSPLNENTMLVPHGVDYEHFSLALTDDLPVPKDIADIPHPRLGFFGLIRDWVDLDLLAEVARRRADWHIVLLGDSTIDLTPYRELANMHFLGRKAYEELPAYCRQFDVGLIPFKINDLTLAVNPIKLREYLAAGLPVVSTPLPEVKVYGNENGTGSDQDDRCLSHFRGSLVEIAESPIEFEEAIERSLDDNESDRQHRAAAMSKETWPAKVEEIAQRLTRSSAPSSPHAAAPSNAHETTSP